MLIRPDVLLIIAVSTHCNSIILELPEGKVSFTLRMTAAERIIGERPRDEVAPGLQNKRFLDIFFTINMYIMINPRSASCNF